MGEAYKEVLSRSELTSEIVRDIIILCVIVLLVRAMLSDYIKDHWLFEPVIDGARITCGMALASLILVYLIPDSMRKNMSYMSNVI